MARGRGRRYRDRKRRKWREGVKEIGGGEGARVRVSGRGSVKRGREGKMVDGRGRR